MTKAKVIEALQDIEANILDESLPEFSDYKCQHGKRKY